jgi:hypothetical protein
MTLCDHVQRRLAAAEPISAGEAEHLRDCAACQSLQRTAAALQAGVEPLRAASQPPPGELRQLQDRVTVRLRTADLRRWSLACAALAAGLASVLLMVALNPRGATEDRVDRTLIAMLDDVAPILSGARETGTPVEELLAGAGFLDDAEADDDLEAVVPAAFGLIEEALENEWL